MRIVIVGAGEVGFHIAKRFAAEGKVRKCALILTVIRDGKVIIPGGDTVIFPMDRILILAASKDAPRVERILAVKVERG